MDTATKQDLLNKKADQHKTLGYCLEIRGVKQKSRTTQDNGYC